jgi:hypothetical protein
VGKTLLWIAVNRATSPIVWYSVLALCTLALPAFANTANDNSPCPDLSGHYRVTEFGEANADAIKALRIGMAGFIDSEVRFERSNGNNWNLFIKSGSTGSLSTSAATMLAHGTDFVCRDGWVELRTPVSTSRKTEQGWYEGQATVRLNKAGSSGLTLVTQFSGSQRSIIYQYDSARLSLPKLGTGIRLNESIRWPDVSEPAPPRYGATPPAPEAPAVLQTRQRLPAHLLGPVIQTGLHPAAQGVRASFKATQSRQVAAFEDRLREASIGYQVLGQPVWSNNAYEFELLILPAGNAAAWRPSLLWVEHELQRVRHPAAEPGPVQQDPRGYRVTLTLSGDVQAQDVAARIHTLSGAFAEVRVQTARDPGAGSRTASLLLVMK